jgi:hypothetical protein
MHLHTTCPRCQRSIVARAAACLVDREGCAVWFICGPCGDLVGQSAVGPQSDAVLTSLVRNGGQVLDVAAPRHPEHRPGGPALSLDDLISLHQSLQDDGAVATALGELTAEQRT